MSRKPSDQYESFIADVLTVLLIIAWTAIVVSAKIMYHLVWRKPSRKTRGQNAWGNIPSQQTCRHCSARNATDAGLCRTCGAALFVNHQPPQGELNWPGIIVLLCLLLLTVAVVIIFAQ